MANKNVQINYYNGSSYDILFPETSTDYIKQQTGSYTGTGNNQFIYLKKSSLLCLIFQQQAANIIQNPPTKIVSPSFIFHNPEITDNNYFYYFTNIYTYSSKVYSVENDTKGIINSTSEDYIWLSSNNYNLQNINYSYINFYI